MVLVALRHMYCGHVCQCFSRFTASFRLQPCKIFWSNRFRYEVILCAGSCEHQCHGWKCFVRCQRQSFEFDTTERLFFSSNICSKTYSSTAKRGIEDPGISHQWWIVKGSHSKQDEHSISGSHWVGAGIWWCMRASQMSHHKLSVLLWVTCIVFWWMRASKFK